MATKFWSSIQNINNWRSSAKTNVLFNLISQQPYIDKVYLYAKDSYEAKHQFLTNKHKGLWLNHFNDSKAFIEYSNDMGDIYESIKKCYSKKKKKAKNIACIWWYDCWYAHYFIMRITNKREVQQIAFYKFI